MTTDRILECPFCGSSDVRTFFDEYTNRPFIVECKDCFAIGPCSSSKQESIELWNRRTGTMYNGKTAEEWHRSIKKLSEDITEDKSKALSAMRKSAENHDMDGFNMSRVEHETLQSVLLMLWDVLSPSPAKPQ